MARYTERQVSLHHEEWGGRLCGCQGGEENRRDLRLLLIILLFRSTWRGLTEPAGDVSVRPASQLSLPRPPAQWRAVMTGSTGGTRPTTSCRRSGWRVSAVQTTGNSPADTEGISTRWATSQHQRNIQIFSSTKDWRLVARPGPLQGLHLQPQRRRGWEVAVWDAVWDRVWRGGGVPAIQHGVLWSLCLLPPQLSPPGRLQTGGGPDSEDCWLRL